MNNTLSKENLPDLGRHQYQAEVLSFQTTLWREWSNDDNAHFMEGHALLSNEELIA
jgi:hypothetical protein